MIDASLRAGILKLMIDLKKKFGLSYLFISHDLSVLRYICNTIAIMYLGRIIEMGDIDKVIGNPSHPYTLALLKAIPSPDPDMRIGEIPIKGEVPTPIDIPSGCRFHPRCPYKKDICSSEEPKLIEVEKDHFVACHLY